MSHNVSMEMKISDSAYRIAIVDDEELYLHKMKHLMISFFPNAEVDLFSSIDSVLSKQKKYVLAIIDVRLGSGNGIDLSVKLSETVSYIVYYSMIVEEMRRAFRYNTIGYLLKTDSDEYLYERFKQYDCEYFSISLLLRTKKGTANYPVKDILKVEMEGRRIYMTLHGGNEREQVLGKSLHEIAAMSLGNLVYINRSVLVNVLYVIKVNVHTGEIVFSNGTVDFISKILRKNVFKVFLEKRDI